MVTLSTPHNDILWQKKIRGHNIEIKKVTSDNLDAAIDIAAQNYPNELEHVTRFYSSATRPSPQWTIPSKERVDSLDAYILYVDGKPAGVAGTQTPRFHPDTLKVSWTGLSYMYRNFGLSDVLDKFIKQQAAEEKQNVSFVSGSPAASTTTTPLLTQMTQAVKQYAAQKLKGEKNRKSFRQKYGDAAAYAKDGRLVDLTDAIAQQVRNPLTESFEQLNNKLFPVETERENVFAPDGLKLYVKPDATGKYEANERRVIAILDEDKKKVIGAMVYNIAAVPADMRAKYGVDAVLGDTYLMTDADYRANGVGRQLIEAATAKSAAFLHAKLGVKDPQIMLMTEQNDPMNMALQDSIKDFAGASVGPTERQNIWGRFGQRLIRGFNYTQVSLREGLDACQGLGLHVTPPKGMIDKGITDMPSDLLHYAVKSYADLALNKQQRLIEMDPDMIAMEQQIKTQPSFPLNPEVRDFVARDNMLMAAQKMAALENRGEESVGDLLTEYKEKKALYSAPDPAGATAKVAMAPLGVVAGAGAHARARRTFKPGGPVS